MLARVWVLYQNEQKVIKMKEILLTFGAHALPLSLDSLWVALVGGEVSI
jgi:hypothetical protein